MPITNDIFIFLLMLVGFFAIFKGLTYINIYRAITKTPTSKISTISSDYHKISGIVLDDTPVKSKFTDKCCVYSKFIIDEHEILSLKNEWKEKISDFQQKNFYLQDETGKILVKPNKAIFDIVPDFELKIKKNSEIPITIQNFLKENKIQFKGGLTGKYKTVRIREWLIEPNDQLYILGEISTDDDNLTCIKYPNELSSKTMFKKKFSHMLYISDKSEHVDLKTFKFKIISWFGGGLSINGFFLLLFLVNNGYSLL